MPGEEKDKLAIAIVVVAVLFGLLLICGGGGAIYYVYQRSLGSSGLADETPPQGDGEGPPIIEVPGAADTEAARIAAVASMRPRYVAGPYVEVEGLLPAGLSSLRRMASGTPTARTLDNPWVVPGSELRGGEIPAGPFEGPPGLELRGHFDSGTPLHVVPGAPTTLTVMASDGEGDRGQVEALLISFEGYEGHFYLPAAAESELGRIQVGAIGKAVFHFGIDAPVTPSGEPVPEGKPIDVTMRVASQDATGRVSTSVERTLRVLPLGTGDLEVTLTMDRATDLDLYVAGPTGTMVYYEHTSGFGAELDLDANAACESNMGVNTEHVFFAESGAVAGTYHVRVAHWRTCIGGAEVDYRVTIRNCGETAVLTGSFDGEGNNAVCKADPGDDRDWCQQVVSFEVTPCRAL